MEPQGQAVTRTCFLSLLLPLQAQRPALEAADQVQQPASQEECQPDQPGGHTHQHPQAEGWFCGGAGTVRLALCSPILGSTLLLPWGLAKAQPLPGGGIPHPQPVSLGPQTWRGQAVGTASKTGEGGPDIHMRWGGGAGASGPSPAPWPPVLVCVHALRHPEQRRCEKDVGTD